MPYYYYYYFLDKYCVIFYSSLLGSPDLWEEVQERVQSLLTSPKAVHRLACVSTTQMHTHMVSEIIALECYADSKMDHLASSASVFDVRVPLTLR